jgi:hypothetical protein
MGKTGKTGRFTLLFPCVLPVLPVLPDLLHPTAALRATVGDSLASYRVAARARQR